MNIALLKENPKECLGPFCHEATMKDIVSEPESGVSLDLESDSALLLDFQPPKQ